MLRLALMWLMLGAGTGLWYANLGVWDETKSIAGLLQVFGILVGASAVIGPWRVHRGR